MLCSAQCRRVLSSSFDYMFHLCKQQMVKSENIITSAFADYSCKIKCL